MTEGKISLTFKGMSHPQQPWLVVSADTALELAQTVASLGIDPTPYLQAVGSSGTISGVTEQAVQNLQTGGLNPSVLPANTPPPQPVQAPQAQSQDPWANTPQAQYQQPAAPENPWGNGQSAAASQGLQCPHGAMQHRNGVSKAGKPYAAWFCPSPQGTPDQCKPIFESNARYVAP